MILLSCYSCVGAGECRLRGGAGGCSPNVDESLGRERQ
jgi:hypothetical protein